MPHFGRMGKKKKNAGVLNADYMRKNGVATHNNEDSSEINT